MSRWASELIKKLNPEEWERVYGKKKSKARSGNKYGAKRTGKGAEGYDSLLEERIGSDLYLRVKSGEFAYFDRQTAVVLQDGSPRERIAVKIDFVAYDQKGVPTAIEAKGVATERWKLILKLWRANPPMRLEIWGGTHKSPKLIEVIEPS